MSFSINQSKLIGPSRHLTFLLPATIDLFLLLAIQVSYSFVIFFSSDRYVFVRLICKYIFLSDQDDIWKNDKVKQVLSIFDKENCLNKLGIAKPRNADVYIKHLNNLKIITELNSKIDSYKDKYKPEQIISIMNYVCYGSKLSFKAKRKEYTSFDKLALLTKDLHGEIYVDKSALKYIYKSNIDIYNVDEIIEYNNYLDVVAYLYYFHKLIIKSNF